MTLRREFFLFYFSPLLLILLGIGLLQLLQERKLRTPGDVPLEPLYREVMQLVDKQYVVRPDGRKLGYAAVSGLARSLDRYCRVYTAGQWARQQEDDNGRYQGIGIWPAVVGGRFLVLKVVARGPAHRARVRDGDIVKTIDGWQVPPQPVYQEVLKRLNGPPGSRVSLVLKSFYGGEQRKVVVVRGTAVTESVYGEILDDEKGLGYIHIDAFKGNTAKQFNAELARLQAEGLLALVLDLRGNRGGLLRVAVAIADRFLKGGTIVRNVGRSYGEELTATASRDDLDLPLAILLDKDSASASEVLAGALQDHGRAIVVGQRSFGKGVVQGLFKFKAARGGIKITIAHYFTPAGRCIEKDVGLQNGTHRRGGLIPDVAVPLSKLDHAYAMTLMRFRRYQPFIRRALGKERHIVPKGWKDPQLGRALALLAGRDEDVPAMESGQ